MDKKLVPTIAKNLSINIFGQNSTLPLESWKFSKKYFQNSKNFLIEKMEEPEFTKDPGITEPLDDHLGTFYLSSDWAVFSLAEMAIESESFDKI